MIVAHDLGTTGDKASLHADHGELVAPVTVRYPTTFAGGALPSRTLPTGGTPEAGDELRKALA